MSTPPPPVQGHTPGLKLTDGSDELGRYIRLWEPKPKIRGVAEALVCEFDHGGGAHCLTAEEALAYAHLFRAAPDLLAALKKLQLQALQSPDLLSTEWGQEALELTRTAITRAEGGEA